MIDKLLVIGGLARGLYSRWLFQRFLSGAVIVAGLTVVTAIMIGVCLVGGFYAGYIALLESGVEPLKAALMITAMALLLTVALGTLTYQWLTRLREMPTRLFKIKAPLTARANEVVDGFFSGLLAEDPR